MSAPPRDRAPEAASPHAGHALFVTPVRGGEGFRATTRGHVLELADPTGPVGPTPDDLFVASIASDLAWSARAFLRERQLSDDVSVTAWWRTQGRPSRPVGIDFTVAVSSLAGTTSDALLAAFEERLAARTSDDSLRVAVVAPLDGARLSLRCRGRGSRRCRSPS